MDKKLNRQILFKPGEAVSEPAVEKKKKGTHAATTTETPQNKPEEKKELTVVERSESVYKWLSSHPLVNLNGICIKIGIDRANFVKRMEKKKELKGEILEKMVTELKSYGYAE